jgi:hypothetical protein
MVTNVAVDRWGLAYHDPQKLENTKDMELVPEHEARTDGAVACSACFDDMNDENPAYDFPYLRGDA